MTPVFASSGHRSGPFLSRLLPRPRVLRLAASLALLFGWFSLAGAAEQASPAQFLSRLTLTSEQREFGGFSGLELSADGTRYTTISDRGWLMEGTITRQGDELVSVTTSELRPIEPHQAIGQSGRDAEGLAMSGDGTLYVSYEGQPRVIRIRDGQSVTFPAHLEFRALPRNGGLEALAIDPEGALVTIPEEYRADPIAPVYRFDGRRWQVIHRIPRTEGFLPVGADYGPDGRLYVLERAFSGVSFHSRVRRFWQEGGDWREQTLFSSGAGAFDNLEGIAVWRDTQSRIRLTMISDDNQRWFQRTELVEYTVTE